MSFAKLFSFWPAIDRTTDMAQRVAGRSRMAVWQRVKDRLATLGPTEARGYIRVRALGVVQEETDLLIEQEGDKIARLRDRIITAATESLIHTIVAQLDQRRTSPALRRVA